MRSRRNPLITPPILLFTNDGSIADQQKGMRDFKLVVTLSLLLENSL